MKIETKTAEFKLNMLIEHTEGVFVGWCIETGISATGETESECAQKLIELNWEHISFALDNDNPKDIFNAAPLNVMNRFLMIARQAHPKSLENRQQQTLFSLSPAIYAAATI